MGIIWIVNKFVVETLAHNHWFFSSQIMELDLRKAVIPIDSGSMISGVLWRTRENYMGQLGEWDMVGPKNFHGQPKGRSKSSCRVNRRIWEETKEC